MDAAGFGAFQQQITRNQAELTDYLKDLDSWKTDISEKDKKLKTAPGDGEKTEPVFVTVEQVHYKVKLIK